tara:strand:+ start:836 stop:1477 length:642 start_codon:yes stop_codon:yes gene_type:complete
MWNKERWITAAILLGATAVMMFPLIMSWSGRNIPMVQELGLARGTWAPLHAWIAALLFAGAYIAYTFRVLPFVREQQREVSLFKLIGVAAAFASGIMEEVVFRRWLMDTVQSYGIGSAGQVLLSGVIFGLFHLVWHAFSADRRFSLYGAASTVVAGAALAVIYLLGGRNLGPCIAAHVLINLVVEPWLVLAAVSGATSAKSALDRSQNRAKTR